MSIFKVSSEPITKIFVGVYIFLVENKLTLTASKTEFINSSQKMLDRNWKSKRLVNRNHLVENGDQIFKSTSLLEFVVSKTSKKPFEENCFVIYQKRYNWTTTTMFFVA